MADTAEPVMVLAVVAILVTVPALLVHQILFAPAVVTGTVEAKTLAGMQNGTSRPIASATADGTTVLADGRAALFTEPLTVNGTVADRLARDYTELQYVVTVRLQEDDGIHGRVAGDVLTYLTDRATFNAVQPGRTTRFAVARTETPQITGRAAR